MRATFFICQMQVQMSEMMGERREEHTSQKTLRNCSSISLEGEVSLVFFPLEERQGKKWWVLL